jgi:hypothetical protein
LLGRSQSNGNTINVAIPARLSAPRRLARQPASPSQATISPQNRIHTHSISFLFQPPRRCAAGWPKPAKGRQRLEQEPTQFVPVAVRPPCRPPHGAETGAAANSQHRLHAVESGRAGKAGAGDQRAAAACNARTQCLVNC